MTTRIAVNRVTVPRDNDGIVRVEFNNGYRLVFVEHFVPMRASTMKLEAVWVEKDGKQLVLFHSKHQYPVNRQPFGFVKTTEGWTVRRFAMYWTAALKYIDAAHAEGRLLRAWRVATLGRTDLHEIQNGEWTMPPPAPSAPQGRQGYTMPASWHERRQR